MTDRRQSSWFRRTLVSPRAARSLWAPTQQKSDSHSLVDDVQQPTTESIDLNAYNAIREEGLQHSHVMDYAGGLTDGIGPRLTGSPNMAKANAWTRDQLTEMGCVNAHLEDWGEFGMGWQQLNTWVRMTEPDTAVFMAQATPWSPSTNGPVTAQAVSVVIQDEKDMAKYKGKLSGQDCPAGRHAGRASARQAFL